jgi:Protein of unknown function (DUF2726)
MEAILIGVVATGIVLLLFLKRAPSSDIRQANAPVLPPGATMTPIPLLQEQEIFLYNLMRLAVQDHYLVFSQVPLWAFVQVDAVGKIRSQVFTRIALKRVDFVLVHPGTRQVEQVVQIGEAAQQGDQKERQRVIESVLDAAGIKLVTLRPQKSYTVPALASLLGLDPEE